MIAPRRERARNLPLYIVTACWLACAPDLAAEGRRSGNAGLEAALLHGPGVMNHPVRVVPSELVSVPEEWPLSADGTITCLTCHSQLPSLRGDGEYHLRSTRRAGGQIEFCQNCHSCDGPRTAASMHWTVAQVAHVSPAGAGATRSRGLDAPSRRCLECHDGVNASESTNPTGASPKRAWDEQRNHPVGIRYPDVGRDGGGRQLRSTRSLPQHVRLPDGKVSCISCHNLYAGRPGLLSVPIEESQLCFTCHNM
jgi:predicted CXXCH cytochrome family protein